MIKPKIQTPSRRRLGAYANAFRIIPDTGREFFLDFVLYSETEQTAEVVARVRIQATMLELVRDGLNRTLAELKEGAKKPQGIPTIIAPGNGEVH